MDSVSGDDQDALVIGHALERVQLCYEWLAI